MNRNYLTLICLVLFGLHQALIAAQCSFRFLDSYFDPLMFVPVCLGISEWLIQKGTNAPFRINTLTIVIFTLVAVLFFEWLIPIQDNRFTADLIDFPFYILGAFLFWRVSS